MTHQYLRFLTFCFSEIFCEMEQAELNVRGTLSQIPQDAVSASLRQDISNLNILKK